jgi:UDP-glucose 4-epimerase
MKILVTGGAGFIGSHTCVELLNAGYDVVIADNLYNAKALVVDRIETITGKRPAFYRIDVLDRAALNDLFDKEKIDAVIHFAGYKAVGESTHKPIEYYHNNIESTLTLCDVMRAHGCKKIVFSSSATVYGDPAFVPITEECPMGETTNPYGATKSMQERILTDIWKADNEWRVMLLRYFNPIGAHKSGLIGEDPKGIPNNLLPYVSQVALGKLEKVHVFGNDYNTPDGTGVRDYIHVVDLAKGHVSAIKGMDKLEGVNIFNLGTGIGYSVLDIIKAFEKACGKEIPYVIDYGSRKPASATKSVLCPAAFLSVFQKSGNFSKKPFLRCPEKPDLTRFLSSAA